jgi:hypothetical protein
MNYSAQIGTAQIAEDFMCCECLKVSLPENDADVRTNVEYEKVHDLWPGKQSEAGANPQTSKSE